MADQIALTLVIILVFSLPYVIALVRRRISHVRPKQIYAPHLFFLCTVRFAPLLTKSLPSAVATILAFLEVLVIWAVGVSLSEWFLDRRPHRGA